MSLLSVREIVTDIFYKKFFEDGTLTQQQILSLQTTIRDGYLQTGRTEEDKLVFYKKDRNTLESKDDLQGQSFDSIVQYIYDNDLVTSNLENNFTLIITDPYDGTIPEDFETPPNFEAKLRDYKLEYHPDSDTILDIVLATEIIKVGAEPFMVLIPEPPYFTDALNLSQIVKPKRGVKVNPEKASEVLDTDVVELLPIQRTRQDDIDDFFDDFNNLIGQAPSFVDVDGDTVGESIPDGGAQDSGSRISEGNVAGAFITRLENQANELNQGQTLETMRNQLNAYLGDVDNVVQVIEDQRPEYENKSNGFLKIRKPNQAIILRNPNQTLEFDKEVTTSIGTGPSFLVEGFTITMWVRFVGKTGQGTLFNFSNPLAEETPYGFRLETICKKRPDNPDYYRIIRLGVRDHIHDTFHDNSWGTTYQPRKDTSGRGSGYGDSTRTTKFWGYNGDYMNAVYPSVPTNDLNEWFFICATYDPYINEHDSLIPPLYPRFGQSMEGGSFFQSSYSSKLFWQNHYEPDQAGGGTIVANSGLGAKCKVEIISRSDLLRARGFKVDSLEYNV